MYTFQEIVAKLSAFWQQHGCLIVHPYDVEKGAGTFNPHTFFRCLGPEPYYAAYIEPCRRPKDGRYGQNPNRYQCYFQYQVMLKPSPHNIQELYLDSLRAIGLDLDRHDIRFVHADWEAPTLGAWGLGWEVWIDGQECTQFTYFQSCGSLPLKPVTGEITYGLERIAMTLQNVNAFTDMRWNNSVSYGDLYLQNEVEWSRYNFEASNAPMWRRHFDDFAAETKRLVEEKLPIPALDFVLKASHSFNMLDARGTLSVAERATYIAGIRDLARGVAEAYLASREAQGFPLCAQPPHPLHAPRAPRELEPQPLPTEAADFLLEVGCEELPANAVPMGLDGLTRAITTLLDDAGISHGEILPLGTPRRLAILVRNLAPIKPAAAVTKRGPSQERAFAADGSCTPAGAGFLRQCGIEPVSLEAVQAGHPRLSFRDGYLIAEQQIAAVATASLLQEALPQLILGLNFPKTMRWADLDISFARPIHWVVALYGSAVIHCVVGPIQSGRASYGHRQLSPAAFDLADASSYVATLRAHCVLVDQTERKEELLRQLKQLEQESNLRIDAKERLLPEVLQLVEWPYATMCDFEPRFLKAPREVLVSEMCEHQKYFPVANAEGVLQNRFVITANIPPTDAVKVGNQRVLSARLADGVFLFEQDSKLPLSAYNDKLKGIMLPKGLGSLHDSIERLQRIVAILAPLYPNANPEWLAEAASLAKADLATEVVQEFPELQGQMGRIYATQQKLPEEVAQALDEQWMPRGENSPLPYTTTGAILSLADKCNNLLGFFGIGLKPTSSSDPYALRRQAIGIVRILLQEQKSLSLRALFQQCFAVFPFAKQVGLVDEVVAFVQARARSVFQGLGYGKEEIEACMAVRGDDCYDVLCRLQTLHQQRKAPSFLPLLEVYKRCRGQITGKESGDVVQAHLHEPEELALYQQITATRPQLQSAIQSRDYSHAFTLLASLQPAIAILFERVKILDENPTLQNNRLLELKSVSDLFETVADFRTLQQ